MKTWKYSDPMLVEAARAVIAEYEINTDFNIPYVGGISINKPRVYIDRGVQQDYESFSGNIYNVHEPLAYHEISETLHIQSFNLNYFQAHQIALRLERAFVEALGLSWVEYDGLMQRYIKKDALEKIESVPFDLLMAPYVQEKDNRLIEHMTSKMVFT